MRFPFLATWLLAFLCGTICAAEPSKVLFGRWRAETVPTGYWIVDRYPDGRFAEKRFLSYDYSKPSEIVVSWGRWKLKGGRYLHITDGSTSAFIRRFAGKWKDTQIVLMSRGRFEFLSSDGHQRYELPCMDTKPLLEVPLNAPDDLRGPNRTILKPKTGAIPSWINAYPKY